MGRDNEGPALFFDVSFSTVGRSTGTQLENLLMQIGPGVDPNFDFKRARALRERRPSGKQEQKSDEVNFDSVRRTINALHGVPVQVQAQSLAVFQDIPEKPVKPPRPSSAFLTRSRNDRRKMDPTERWRAPDAGIYKPSIDVGRPRFVGTVPFDSGFQDSDVQGREPSRGEQGEIGDTIMTAARHTPIVDMSKLQPRKSFLDGVTSNHNTFTGGIDEAYERRSQAVRQPCFAISRSKSAGHVDVSAESLAEPGLYNVKDKLVRPRSGQQNLRFERQCPRRPLSAPCATVGQQRLATNERNKVLSSERRVTSTPDMARCLARPPLIPLQSSDGPPDAEALQRELAVDLLAVDAKLAGRRRPRTADSFRVSLSRQQHFLSTRQGGQDPTPLRIRENLEAGPTSVELVGDVRDRPIFTKPVVSPDFDHTSGREHEGRHADPPARTRALKRNTHFSRLKRVGDTRCRVVDASWAAGAIVELRANRAFEPLQLEESGVP